MYCDRSLDMIKLKSLIDEGVKYEYGCVMACIDGDYKSKILQFNNSIISDEIIYDNEEKEFGREKDPHVTIKFGLTESYTKEEMEEMLKDVSPFIIKIKGLSIFESDDFDVVKLDVSGEKLTELNKKFSKLPNEDEHPEYHPHCTMAYVKSGEGKKFDKRQSNKFSDITIGRIVYSDMGSKTYYTLKNSNSI